MKVIDLLNKIANNGVDGEIRHIKYYNRNDEENDICMLCYENLIYKLNNGSLDLNDEVEIIEEDKKTPEKLDKYADVSGDLACEWTFSEKKLKDKINEIIDYLDKGEHQ